MRRFGGVTRFGGVPPAVVAVAVEVAPAAAALWSLVVALKTPMAVSAVSSVATAVRSPGSVVQNCTKPRRCVVEGVDGSF
jgi:hypothetical protein